MLQILNLARKYILDDLLQECTQFLETRLTADNICDILNHSEQYGEEELSTRCVEFAWSKGKELLTKPNFFEMSQPALLRFLRHNRSLQVTECEILEACLKWASHNKLDLASSQEIDIGGSFIYLIRFYSITAEQFTTHLADSGLLTSDEKCMFFCFLTGGGTKYEHELATLGFYVTPHIKVFDLGSRYVGHLTQRTGSSGTLNITANRNMLLTAIAVFGGPTITNTNVAVNVRATPAAFGQPFHNVGKNTSLHLDGSDRLHTIPQNIRIEAGIVYKMTVSLDSNGWVQNPTNINHASHNFNIKIDHAQFSATCPTGRLGIVAQITCQLI